MSNVVDQEYAKRLEQEFKAYAENVNIHDLPQIYHYWSNKYLRPKLRTLGITEGTINSVFADPIAKVAARSPGKTVTVASLGAGNCDLELAVVKELAARGVHAVEMHCFEFNPEMIRRAKQDAEQAGLGGRMRFHVADLNQARFEQTYDVFMANQSLHHLVGLGQLFAEVKAKLNPGGYFVTSDMIGRNGHMLWPEAYAVLSDLWKLLPDRYKYNHALKRFEATYDNWDCSMDGFEGIRAQDILPLLVKEFHFELFIGFANFIDIFIGRGFGHNYDAKDPFDLAFVDFAAQLEERLIRDGKLTPTHLIAWMKKEEPGQLLSADGQRPETSVRDPKKP